ncbi:HepT-like ribonuclease domain-containing protein, partial [uncultured Selenomonas sp.]
RNLFAHEYESADKDLLWETITNDISALYAQLQKIASC